MGSKFAQFLFDVNYLAKVSRIQLSSKDNLKEILLFLLTLRYHNPISVPEIDRITRTYLLDAEFVNYLTTKNL